MGVWMDTIGGEKVVRPIQVMNVALLTESFIHSDETPLQVLKSDKAPSSEHYVWGQSGRSPATAASESGRPPTAASASEARPVVGAISQ